MGGSLPRVSDALTALDALAPPHMALDDDPRGLLVGDPKAPLRGGVVVALDVTPDVVDAARSLDAALIVSHHPLIYHPLQRVRADERHPGAVVLACARHGISVACAHTNWDVAPGGINDILAGLLGLTAPRPLRVTYREPLVSLTVFVPPTRRSAVGDALAGAGAGRIGNYDGCSFWTGGTGTFRPLAGSRPFMGETGRMETVTEDRLEMVLPARMEDAVIAALRAAHPYEEPAFFVHALSNTFGDAGIGRIGTLPDAVPARAFLRTVRDALAFPEVRMVADDPDRLVRTVAVCGGAGGFLMEDAARSGADALVTADIRHHEYIDARALGLVLIDAGHAQTEIPGTKELARLLASALTEWNVPVTFAG